MSFKFGIKGLNNRDRLSDISRLLIPDKECTKGSDACCLLLTLGDRQEPWSLRVD